MGRRGTRPGAARRCGRSGAQRARVNTGAAANTLGMDNGREPPILVPNLQQRLPADLSRSPRQQQRASPAEAPQDRPPQRHGPHGTVEARGGRSWRNYVASTPTDRACVRARMCLRCAPSLGGKIGAASPTAPNTKQLRAPRYDIQSAGCGQVTGSVEPKNHTRNVLLIVGCCEST